MPLFTRVQVTGIAAQTSRNISIENRNNTGWLGKLNGL